MFPVTSWSGNDVPLRMGCVPGQKVPNLYTDDFRKTLPKSFARSEQKTSKEYRAQAKMCRKRETIDFNSSKANRHLLYRLSHTLFRPSGNAINEKTLVCTLLQKYYCIASLCLKYFKITTLCLQPVLFSFK